MSIPIKCFTCGMVIADKYAYYLSAVRQKKMHLHANALKDNAGDGRTPNFAIDQLVYLTSEYHKKTPEGEVMDDMGLTKSCCRRHLLTHVDM